MLAIGAKERSSSRPIEYGSSAPEMARDPTGEYVAFSKASEISACDIQEGGDGRGGVAAWRRGGAAARRRGGAAASWQSGAVAQQAQRRSRRSGAAVCAQR